MLVTLGQIAPLKKKFLEAFRLCGNVTEAAAKAGIDRRQHYRWLDEDKKKAEAKRSYWKAFTDAEDEAVEALEKEARRRALDGWEEPVFHLGKRVDVIRKYSDVLLIFLLKGHRPAKYRERFEHTGSDGGPVRILVEYAAEPNPK